MTAHSEILNWLAGVTNINILVLIVNLNYLDCLNCQSTQADSDAESLSQHLSTPKLVSHPLSPPETVSNDTAIHPPLNNSHFTSLDPAAPKRRLMSDRGAPTPKRTRALRETLPCGVINHTDFLPLRGRPIAMATWYAAQWKLLSRLVYDAGGSLDDLSFLPAVLVNGNE
ncbi:hypothetical protein OQA88_8869 [Cercophora sp. LCS_1]